MALTITRQTDEGYIVNGKAVYKNAAGVWIPEYHLEFHEESLFKKHLKTVQPGVKFKFRNVEPCPQP